MNYSEYQVWFHVYNSAITSLFRQDIKSSIAIERASQAADKALEKYGEVEQSQASGEPPFDLQGLVDSMAKSAMQQNGKPSKKR